MDLIDWGIYAVALLPMVVVLVFMLKTSRSTPTNESKEFVVMDSANYGAARIDRNVDLGVLIMDDCPAETNLFLVGALKQLKPKIANICRLSKKWGLLDRRIESEPKIAGFVVSMTDDVFMPKNLLHGPDPTTMSDNLKKSVEILDGWLGHYLERLTLFTAEREDWAIEAYVSVQYYDFVTGEICTVVDALGDDEVGFTGPENLPADVLVLFSGRYEKIFSARLIPISDYSRYLTHRGF